MKQEDLKKFFEFCTGLCNVPINGFGSLKGIGNKVQKFTIEPLIDYDLLIRKLIMNLKLLKLELILIEFYFLNKKGKRNE